MKHRRSQITIFLIIGAVLVLIVVVVIFLTTSAAKKKSKEEIINVKEIPFDIQPINNFITECLSIVSKDALKKLGDQGGYLFTSQGGTIPDYEDRDQGLFYVTKENIKIAYNILEPRFPVSIYFSNPPEYPWTTFPYTDETKNEQDFNFPSAFGINNLPYLNVGPHSMEKQLTVFLKNNVGNCLDFSIFEEQGFDISEKEKNITVIINENEVVFIMEYTITIEDSVSGEKTELKDFLVKHNVRLGKLRTFVNNLIASDISDIEFNIIESTSADFFSVGIQRDAFDHDDLIIITDQQSSLGNSIYQYSFARKNRNPALFYLSPAELTLPPGTLITEEILIGSQELQAMDPDEDEISQNSFSIKTLVGNNNLPIELQLRYTRFKITVTDGELEDHQIIQVNKE